jgi:lysophospholipase L1-like esterase
MLEMSTSRRGVLNGALMAAAAAAAMSLPARSFAGGNPNKPHVVLLGDSIFDNGVYVGEGPAVIEQVRAALPMGARATLAAIDGSLTAGVQDQLKRVPKDATHLVVSAGGNDALHASRLMTEPASSVAEALAKLGAVREQFRAEYRAMLDGVQARGLPVAVCTIYDPRFEDAAQTRLASVGLTVFNDCITREAGTRGLGLIDLRLICNSAGDLANPIEPSSAGGAKIAAAIAAYAAEYDWRKGRAEVFAEAPAKI